MRLVRPSAAPASTRAQPWTNRKTHPLFGYSGANTGGGAAISHALKLDPQQSALSHFNLGNALFELKHHEEALASYDRAIAIQPDFVQALSNRGNALFELKRHEEALASYDRAIAIRPDFAEAYHGRGTVLRTCGQIEEARHILEKAVALAPRKVEFDGSLAECKRFVDGDPELTLINALANDLEALPEGDQIHL